MHARLRRAAHAGLVLENAEQRQDSGSRGRLFPIRVRPPAWLKRCERWVVQPNERSA